MQAAWYNIDLRRTRHIR